ncbi:MAG: amidase [Pseudomonadales bacterium]|nr:amidase [Pseudomonadales bacterium]
MQPIHYLSLTEVGRRIKSGELSAVEVTERMLERIERLEPELHGFARVLGDQARATAARLDRERSAGQPLGLLHGIPIAIKDLLNTRGIATASGTRVMADYVPDEDATVVSRLKQAGAVIIGKTQLTEGAFAVHHPAIVAPVNPWKPTHWPGVSSSGSGVTVAAGLAFGALGSDTGGSIRFPSASCGIVGIKPTYGRVSRHGAFPLAESLDHIGPMTRTVEDAARLLQVIAGRDPADATTLGATVPDYPAMPGERLPGLTIGIDPDYTFQGVDPVVAATVRDALGTFRALGAEVVELRMPPMLGELVRGWNVTCAMECARAHAKYYPARKAEYGPVLASLIERGLRTGPAEYQALERTRAAFRDALDGLLADVDVIIAPCMPMLPPDLATMDAVSGAASGRVDAITFTAPFDYSGHPTISLPAGLSEDGLPRSFQLVGRHLGEPTLIRAGAAFEAARGPLPHPLP